jgi:rod shape-determining protein MreD
VRAVGIGLLMAGALAVQYTLSRFFLVRGIVAVDFVLVVVVYVALTSGPTTGMLTGTVAGLVQDAMSSGVIGIGGLAKTIVGFIGGIIGTQFIVAQPLPRFVVFFMATLLDLTVFMGLYVLLDIHDFGARPYAPILRQAAANAVTGVVMFQLIEFLPGAVERRRAAKPRLRR